jgi:prevent-host-death family protein
MNPLRAFEIIYAPIVKAHLKTIEPKYYPQIADSIEEQLLYQPDIETKNRKPLKRPVVFGAQWEVRFGPGNSFRAFYKVNREDYQVEILAIGIKQGNRLYVGGSGVSDMRIASVADVKAKFSGYIKESERGPVVVTKNGKPVAMLLSVTDEEEIERLILAYSPKFQGMLQIAEQQIREGKGIKHEDFWREVQSEQNSEPR